jgi:hypothetical protein
MADENGKGAKPEDVASAVRSWAVLLTLTAVVFAIAYVFWG